MNIATVSKLRDVLNIVEESVDNRSWKFRLNSQAPQVAVARADIAKFLSDNRYNIRYHSVTSTEDIAAIWDKIRENRYAFDFVMDVTTDLRLNLLFESESKSNDRWQSVSDAIAMSLGFLRDSEARKGVCDPDFLSRGKDTKEWKEVLNTNPWLITTYLLSIASVDEAIIRLSQNVKVEDGAEEQQ